MVAGPGGPVFLGFIKELVADQEARKASLEQRGVAVITTSGVLATLLFGLVGLVTKSSTYVLPRDSHVPLGIALGLFALAALGGVATNAIMPYTGIRPSHVKKVVTDFWDAYTVDEAEQMVAVTWAKILVSAKRVNRVKAWILVVAQVLEVGALGALTWALAVVLTH